MAKIILIETTAADCTVALGIDGIAVASARADEPRAHASMTAPLVKAVLDEAGLKLSDCDAVCLSKGPGSYTGLRVGSSTAKGLCFGASLPLIALDTSTLIASQALSAAAAASPSQALPATSTGTSQAPTPTATGTNAASQALSAGFSMAPDGSPSTAPSGAFRRVVTMIDARRMEVYASTFAVDRPSLNAPFLSTPGSLKTTSLDSPSLSTPGSLKTTSLDSPSLPTPVFPEGTSPAPRTFTPTSLETASPDSHGAEAGRGAALPRLRQLTPVAPVVVEEGTFSELSGAGPVLFAGDGALKCREVLSGAFPDAVFAEVFPHADAMAPLAEAAFAASRFEDIAYFEPFYLKQFVATTPRNKLF